jgi:hypothetical protein
VHYSSLLGGGSVLEFMVKGAKGTKRDQTVMMGYYIKVGGRCW